MEKIYYENKYIKDFTTDINDIKEIDGKFHVTLDKTAFFPGGGGQHCDLGTIDGEALIDVYEDNEIVYHVLEARPSNVHNVKCVIDWPRRLDGMHQHLGQHILSGSFFNLFNANTFAIHLGADISTVDIYGTLTEEQVRTAEKLANKVIGDNLEVLSFVPNKTELENLTLRRALPNTDEEIRIVKIGDFDINACCGLHPAYTQELRLIKIKRFEKHKEGTRIEFLAGQRAVDDSYKKDAFQASICTYLNCNDNEAMNVLKNLNTALKDANEKNKKLNTLLAHYEAKELFDNAEIINEVKIIKKVFDNSDLKYVSSLTSKLTENENVVALMAVKLGERVNLIFSCSKKLKDLKMNELLKEALSKIDGKGGGSPFQAQGSGKNNGNVEDALNASFAKISELL